MRFCCQDDGMPVFGTDKNTGKGYCKNHQYLRTDLDKRSIVQKAMDKQKGVKDFSKLKNLPQNKELVSQHKTKSEMLIIADRVFSRHIINRDKDANGNVQCPCCLKVFSVEQTDNSFYKKEDGFDRINNDKGNKIIQALHFIDRGVYLLRFDEDNVHAGCCYCNLDMHLNKNGFAYRNYYQFMIDNYGEEAVAEMTVAHRKINKLELTQLKNIIEHYRES